MKIIELLKTEKPSLSFEVFPPKTDLGFESVERAVLDIAALSPSFMSVTYGAGGDTSKYTLKIAQEINEKYFIFSRYSAFYTNKRKNLSFF